MIKVKATDAYTNNKEKLNRAEDLIIRDNTLERVPRVGEVFEVTEERFNVLNGNNIYGLVFVERIEEEEEKKKTKTTTRKTNKKKIS